MEPDLWWHSAVEGFTRSSVTDLLEGCQSGVRFTTICINVPRHLQYLLSSFRAAGGKLVKARLPTEAQKDFFEVLESVDRLVNRYGLGKTRIIVNATGFGARALVQDKDIYPTKGQTVLVKGESKFAKTTDKTLYVIPRPWSGTTILGGTREEDW